MRRWVLVLALAVAGCGPSFKDDAEELSYLSALSNPSPAQWKRREELRGKAERADILRQGRIRSMMEAAAEKAERERAARPPKDEGPVTVEKGHRDN